MFSNTPYRIVPLARCILLKLYVEHVNDNDLDRFSAGDISQLFSTPVSRNLIESALSFLHSREGYSRPALVARRGSNKDGNVGFRLTAEGIRAVEVALQDKSSDLSYFLANGDESLPEVAGFNGVFWSQDEIPNVADWTQLRIDAEDPGFLEAVESVESAITAIEESNEFEAQHADQKPGILEALTTGLTALKSAVPTRAQLSGLLVRPLKWVATTFASSFVGQAAKTAAQKVVDLILAYF